MREVTVEKELVQRAGDMGGLALKWVSPGNAGIPDRLVILPMAGGRCVCCGTAARVGALELKRPGGTLRALQERQAEELRGVGLPTGWADTPGAVLAWLQGLQKGARP